LHCSEYGDDMKKPSNIAMTQAELEHLLDVYGGDRSRWPTEARNAAGHLVARDAPAQRLLAEAEALDRLLERAPLPALAREVALTDRIITAALRSPRVVRTQDAKQDAKQDPKQAATNLANATAVISLDSRTLSSRRSLRAGAGVMSGINRVAGLLAACLLFGVYIGVSNLVQRALPAIAELTGLALPGGSTTAMVQMDALDEDLL
jgi:hypothetical protein